MSKSVSRPLALMFLLLLTLPTAIAQEQGTELTGVVLDASGQPLAGHPLSLVTAQWGKVVMHPTEDDGTFVVSGEQLVGDFELLVFSPSGSRDVPIASKKFTLAAGQKLRLEIRVGSDNPGGAAGSPAAGTTLGAMGVDRMTVLTAALVLAAGLVIFFVMRSRRRTVE